MPDMAARAEAALSLYHVNVKPLWDLDALSAGDHQALLTAVTELGTGLRADLHGDRLRSLWAGNWLLRDVLRDVTRAVTPATVDAALAPHQPELAPTALLYDAAGQVIPYVTNRTRYPARSKCGTCGRDIFRHEYGLARWDHAVEPAPGDGRTAQDDGRTAQDDGRTAQDDGRTVQQHVIEAILRLLDRHDVLTIADDAGGTQMHAILYVGTFPLPIWVKPDGQAGVPLGLDPDGRVIRAAHAALHAHLDTNETGDLP